MLMRTLDSFPKEIRKLTKDQLEAAVLDETGRRHSWDAAAWLAKTRELGGADSRLGQNRQQALALLYETLPYCEYQAVLGILLEFEPASAAMT
jgi:hypothetical protein